MGRFKSVEKVFLCQGVPKEDIDKTFKDFKSAKDANKIKDFQEKNIDTWGKGNFEEFKKFVDNVSTEKSKTQHKETQKAEGAKLVAENGDWRVYNILEHKACMLYGSNTKWCITQEDVIHWVSYIQKMNFYFFISKTRDRDDPLAKIAMNIDAKGEKQFWEATNARIIAWGLNLPEFKPEHATEGVIVNGKKITIEQLSKMENLEIKGGLDLYGTQIKELPQGLKVGGLDLERTPIKELPQDLKVDGDLDLERTQIKELPQGLTVGGGLYLYGRKIKELPQGLKVKKAIYVDDKSKIKCSAELRRKLS